MVSWFSHMKRQSEALTVFVWDPFLCLRYQMNRDHRLLHVRSLFDLRLVVTHMDPFSNSHYGEDNTDETEQIEVKHGTCGNSNKESQGY